jgi:7-cyano-7-deazaguanine synthase in queuosine biosynthesis
MILSDGNVEVDWFEKFFQTNKKNIGLWLSGGVDSTLILYFLCKFITETKTFDKKIFPIIAVQTDNVNSKCEEKTLLIIEQIKMMYPEVKINLLERMTYSRSPNELTRVVKQMKLRVRSKMFIKKHNLDILIQGPTMNPSENIGKSYSTRDTYRDKPQIEYREYYPWWNVDKKFTAFQYQKYNLMQNLFTLTESCIEDREKKSFPCKECFWCEEKYWAFGFYDGGIQ